MDADEIYIENTRAALKQAQNCIYFGFIISALMLFVFSDSADPEIIVIPIINLNMGTRALTMIALISIYFLNGLLLSYSVGMIEKNMKHITNDSTRNALVQFPSIIFAGGFYRLVIIFGLLGAATLMFTEGFSLSFYLGTLFGIAIGFPYGFGMIRAIKIQEANTNA